MSICFVSGVCLAHDRISMLKINVVPHACCRDWTSYQALAILQAAMTFAQLHELETAEATPMLQRHTLALDRSFLALYSGPTPSFPQVAVYPVLFMVVCSVSG